MSFLEGSQIASVANIKAFFQSSSSIWFLEGHCRVTASVCKQIVCRHKSDFTALIRRKLSRDFSSNKVTCYGLESEKLALNEYVKNMKTNEPKFCPQPTGLVISTESPWFAASPDGLGTDPVHGNCIVEIKCLYLCRDMSIAMASQKPLFCLKADGVSILKRSHSYHCQVQHQLCVTGVQWADFVLWTPTEMFIERIKYDEPFMMANLVELKAFYFDHFCLLYSQRFACRVLVEIRFSRHQLVTFFS